MRIVGHQQEVPRVELAKTLSPIIEKTKTEKGVFVDFEDAVPYGEAVSAMDTENSPCIALRRLSNPVSPAPARA